MAFIGMCPYLKDARSCERTVCECAKFTFPDRISRREILYKYCGHPTGWQTCIFKSVMDGYYERKYSLDGCSEGVGEEGKPRADSSDALRKSRRKELK